MLRVAFSIVFVVVLARQEKQAPTNNVQPGKLMDITRTEDCRYGCYHFLLDNGLMIHQAHIPAISRNKGSETEVLAKKKTEDLVADKIKRNIMPPTLSSRELEGIGIAIEDLN